ncbi:ETC complex I subunit [Anaplasma bovis]|uniref:ETC complex I subunit n=1 Tax=Anaplasma bovis TaxID=186733 RepID=UPI002FF3444E
MSECEVVRAVVRRPAKNVMQSGKHRSDLWCVEFECTNSMYKEHLMGWTGSVDTSHQVRLTFATKEAAIDFVKEKGFSYIVLKDQVQKRVRKSYAENFTRRRGL